MLNALQKNRVLWWRIKEASCSQQGGQGRVLGAGVGAESSHTSISWLSTMCQVIRNSYLIPLGNIFYPFYFLDKKTGAQRVLIPASSYPLIPSLSSLTTVVVSSTLWAPPLKGLLPCLKEPTREAPWDPPQGQPSAIKGVHTSPFSDGRSLRCISYCLSESPQKNWT